MERIQDSRLANDSLGPVAAMGPEKANPILANERKIFPFFELPQELRDNIYSLCGRTKYINEAIGGSYNPWCDGFISPYPKLLLLLVSHQFGQEYREEISRYASLLLVQNESLALLRGQSLDILEGMTPFWASKLRHVVLRPEQKGIYFCDSNVVAIQKCVKQLMEDFTGLQTIEIYLYNNWFLNTTEDDTNFCKAIDAGFHCEKFFAMDLPSGVAISLEYSVTGYFCCPLSRTDDTDLEQDDVDPLWEELDDCQFFNSITYSLTPSEGPYTIGEVEWAVTKCGTVSYEELLESLQIYETKPGSPSDSDED